MGTTMKLTHTNLTVLVTVLALPMVAVGQMADLRRDVFQSEEDFYEIYNELNDNKEYNVRCRYETPTGTRIKNHVCRARYVTKAFSAHAARNRSDISRVANQDSNPAMAAKTAKFQENLETLLAANPDLQAALIRYNTARARFMEARANN